MRIKLNFKSKKALTLIEMIVSIAIISLISITLLAFMLPASNSQADAVVRNKSTFSAANELEKSIYAQTEGNDDFADMYTINETDYVLSFELNGETFNSKGTLFESTNGEINLRAFWPKED